MTKFFFISIIAALISTSSVMASGILISPLILYERASSPLEIDGVSSGYKFGIIGFNGKYRQTEKFSTEFELGYAYVPSETVTFDNVIFKGAITGLYLSTSGQYNLKKLEKSHLYLEADVSHRHLQANDLSGERNNKPLFGTSSTTINSCDTLLGLNFRPSSQGLFSIASGLSFWTFSARGTASNQSQTINAWKNIKTTAIDPLLKVSFKKIFKNSEINADFHFKSLYSKFNSSVISVTLKYEYLF